ncbi:MAG: helix-turn-helix transcriptional regulator [Spirochaetales bacterium]|nr:helix-turn-helix transcriptional regulator [Spirochaetales bacterium]
MELSKLSKMFKALSNEQRLKIFKMIYGSKGHINLEEPGCCVSVEKTFTAACNCMNISRSTISHHIKELANADLIICERHGKNISCKVNRDALKEIRDFI